MGTAAAIAVQQQDGSIRTIYLSGGGEPSGAGKVLLQAWNTQERVRQLLEPGDLLRLGAELGEEHDREDPSRAREHNWCTAHTRDHGSKYERPDDRQAQTFPNLVMFLLQSAADRTPWSYVYGPGGWMVFPELHYPGIALRQDTLEELEACEG